MRNVGESSFDLSPDRRLSDAARDPMAKKFLHLRNGPALTRRAVVIDKKTLLLIGLVRTFTPFLIHSAQLILHPKRLHPSDERNSGRPTGVIGCLVRVARCGIALNAASWIALEIDAYPR